MTEKYPIGLCKEMCPEKEIIFREKEGLLHELELKFGSTNKADWKRVVKQYSRSAAGKQTQDVNDLRTINAILNTIYFLFHDVIKEKEDEWHIVYDFIVDRSRAIRQDMIIQNFDRPDFICILQPMVRFYAYAAYRLCEAPVHVFDPVMNKSQLSECLHRLLALYRESDILVTKFDINRFEEARKKILYFTERPFMEALYLILHLGNTDAISRALSLPQIWKTPLVYHCLYISIEYWKCNYVRVCRLIKQLPPLLLTYSAVILPTLRYYCLKSMSVAYSCKNLSFPAGKLAELLLYEKTGDLIFDCKYYGIKMNEDNIMFNKNEFDQEKPQLGPKHLKMVDDKLDGIDLADLLLYVKLDLETLA